MEAGAARVTSRARVVEFLCEGMWCGSEPGAGLGRRAGGSSILDQWEIHKSVSFVGKSLMKMCECEKSGS